MTATAFSVPRQLFQYAKYYGARRFLKKEEMVAVSNTGLRFRFKTEDGIGRYLYTKGVYEKAESRFLFDTGHLPRDGIVLDIGANIGYYALHMASYARKVYAFEPHPLNFRLLKENVARNQVENVEVLSIALGDAPGKAELFATTAENGGGHTLLKMKGRDTIQIEVETVDRFLESRGILPGEVSFVKIDVEGFEHQVLRGAQSLLESGVIVFAEFSPGLMEKAGDKVENFVQFMAGLEYSPQLVDGTQLVPIPMEWEKFSQVSRRHSPMIWWSPRFD